MSPVLLLPQSRVCKCQSPRVDSGTGWCHSLRTSMGSVDEWWRLCNFHLLHFSAVPGRQQNHNIYTCTEMKTIVPRIMKTWWNNEHDSFTLTPRVWWHYLSRLSAFCAFCRVQCRAENHLKEKHRAKLGLFSGNWDIFHVGASNHPQHQLHLSEFIYLLSPFFLHLKKTVFAGSVSQPGHMLKYASILCKICIFYIPRVKTPQAAAYCALTKTNKIN